MSKPTTAPRSRNSLPTVPRDGYFLAKDPEMSKQQRWKNREMRDRGYECWMDGKLLVAEKEDSRIVHDRNGHVVDEKVPARLQ